MSSLWQFGLMALCAIGSYLYWDHWFGHFKLKLLTLITLLLIGTPFMAIGGHAAYFIANDFSSEAARSFFMTAGGWSSGYLSVGVLLGFSLAMVITALAYSYSFAYLADLLAPAIFAFSVVWRIGCFFDGCCFGTETALPWGVAFPLAAEMHGIDVPRHPVQLYEAGMSVVLFLLTPAFPRWLGTQPGKGLLAALCVLLYSIERLLLDFLRVGATFRPVALGLSLTQLIAIASIIVFGLITLLLLRARKA
jgi:phosphatidylglycerol:prolipoprotein diacylglycerol transferase